MTAWPRCRHAISITWRRTPLVKSCGQIVSIYGEALSAGQNQIVTLNRGSAEGLERGHVLALWRDGVKTSDRTSGQLIKLPDERHGLLFVFRVFDHMSYALILTVQEPVKAGIGSRSPEVVIGCRLSPDGSRRTECLAAPGV